MSGAVATTDSFFALIGAHPVWHSRWVNERGKPAFKKPLTAEKQSIKRQLYTTHVGAVGWEPHSSSTTTCAGKVDHKLPVNQSKGHTYTNPRPSHYLKHVHSHITRHSSKFKFEFGSTAIGSSFAHTGAQQHGMAIGQ